MCSGGLCAAGSGASGLCDARLLVTTLDPTDKRRTHYALAPEVPLVKTERGTELDFGCRVLRL